MKQRVVNIGYGLLAPEIEEQLNEQGLTLGDQAEKFEKLKYSLNMLHVHLLTESDHDKYVSKLNSQIMKEVSTLKDTETEMKNKEG